jgi:hypothetical protein
VERVLVVDFVFVTGSVEVGRDFLVIPLNLGFQKRSEILLIDEMVVDHMGLEHCTSGEVSVPIAV